MNNTYKTPCEEYPEEFETDENWLNYIRIVRKDKDWTVWIDLNPRCRQCMHPDACIEKIRKKLSEITWAEVQHVHNKKH